MGQELVIVPAGLYTDPSPHGAAPPGALRTATNVVLRRQGAVEPRPGFQQNLARPDVDLNQVHAILGYPGTEAVLYVGEARVSNTTYLVDSGGAVGAVTMDSGGALPWIRGFIQAAAARKNLYLSTSDAVRKITASNDTTASKTGTPPCYITISPGATPGTAVPSDGTVSYRAIVVRKDANGVIVRSAPSNRMIFANASINTMDVNVTINLSTQDDNPGSGNIVELYRSLSQVDTPFDEHFFVKSFTGGTVITGVDDVAEADLGAALYTNDDEEGAANANMRPPAAKDVCEFNGSLFLANLTYPAQLQVSWNNNANLTAADNNGVGQRTLTGTFTNGSAVVTGVATTAGFRVGQVIDESLNEWAGTVDLPRIISLTATSVTFSANYTGTTGSKSKSVFDSIRVGSQYFPVGASSWEACIQAFWDGGMLGTHTPATSVYALSDDVTTVTSTGSRINPTFRTLRLQAINPTSSPFVVNATHGSEYTPPLPEPTVTGLTADQDVFPSGVCWSKTFEPEHFSLVDMEIVGAGRADIWRIKKGRDALWILKTDGIWRLSGAGRDAGFRIDPVSKAKLITPLCVADVFDQVYAWTDQGILGLDSGANAVQSQPVRDQLITLQALAGRYVTLYDTWLCSNQKAQELLLNIQNPQNGTNQYLLVYNFLTAAWTRWDLAKKPSCGGAPLGALEFGIRSPGVLSGPVYVTTLEGESLHDSNISVNVTNVTGLSVTIAPGTDWFPEVGDAVGGFLVGTVNNSTQFTVTKAGLTTGAQTAWVAYQCEIEPVACTTKNPSILKLWEDGSILWGNLVAIETYSIAFTSSLNRNPVTIAKGVTVTSPVQADCSHRFITPRAHARTEQLFVKTIVRQAAANLPTSIWSWHGMSLFHLPMGPRVRAR